MTVYDPEANISLTCEEADHAQLVLHKTAWRPRNCPLRACASPYHKEEAPDEQ